VVDNAWLESLLPVRVLNVEMSFTEASTPGFFHQAALTAWLRRLLGSPDDYDLYITIDCLEQGRRHYHAGDRYRFTVLGSGETGAVWLSRLALLLHEGVKGLKWDSPMPFRNNWKLECLLDLSGDQQLTLQDKLPCIDMAAIQRDIDYLGSQSRITIRLNSPWRVLREKADKATLRGEMRFCRDNVHLQQSDSPLWLIRIGDALRDLVRRKGGVVPPRKQTQSLDNRCDIFWVDASYQDVDGNRKPMGGLLGEISAIEPAKLNDEQLLMLILGQYLGVGQRRAFGYGRYQLIDASGQPMFSRPSSFSLLQQAMAADNLTSARRSVLDEPADLNDEPLLIDTAADDCESELHRISERLLHGCYAPPPLNGFVHEDADGGLRPLAAPPVYDRILQRAVHQVLSPMLDAIMDRGSYGFRPGRSRYQVRDLIQSLYRQGYRWVFESDIRNFFDMVAWGKLEVRLRSIIGDDPALEIIMRWIQSPVRYQNQLIRRSKGLPQGSPISPVLANLMLDDFDHDLRDAGCALIRFADDFLIVAKSRGAAEAGGRKAQQALLDVGLELKADKTRVVPFSDGFRFLGFMFVDGMAVEAKPRIAADAGKTPAHSWLASVTTGADGEATDHQLRGESPVPIAPYQETTRVLIFCGEPALIYSRGGRLCIERDDACVHAVPWAHLDAVMLFGRHQITTPALHEALRHDVPVHMATSGGGYLGVTASGKAGIDQSEAWLAQQHCFADQAWAIDAAKSIVESRIRHMSETLRRRGGLSGKKWKSSLDASLRGLSNVRGSDQLNGIEGNATKVYFASLRELVPAGFGFECRKRRPPPDPFNALLSLGYTLLYAHVDSLLRVDGLLPVKGFYHRSHGSHSALASDLMEPFRHVVEREALHMLQRKRLKPDDFTINENGCLLTAPARRLYLASLSGAFLQPVKARGGEHSATVLEHIHMQNLALKFCLAGKSSRFEAWRMR